jgi:hypothetical protein
MRSDVLRQLFQLRLKIHLLPARSPASMHRCATTVCAGVSRKAVAIGRKLISKYMLHRKPGALPPTDSGPVRTVQILKALEPWFWMVFILLPMGTGLLAYHWLPNESFDAKRHTVLESHEVCHGDPEVCGDKADVWEDRVTGRVYSRGDFAKHREAEQRRIAGADFLYGMVGCLFFAYMRSREAAGVFFSALGKAICINCLLVAIMWAYRQ